MCSLVIVTEVVVVVAELVAVVEFVKIKTSVAISVPIRIAATRQQNKHKNKQSRLKAGRFLKTKIEPRN
jgi:hypothetical protein